MMNLADWSRHLWAVAAWQGEPSPMPPASAWGRSEASAVDRMLWSMPAMAPGSAAVDLDLPGLRLDDAGPLSEPRGSEAIEVWVDRELSAMHALERWALEREDRLSTRLFSAVRWHLEHTGAENSTHRPWALHVFLLERSPEARLYAEGQLHACLAEGGADECSRWILAHASRRLAARGQW